MTLKLVDQERLQEEPAVPFRDGLDVIFPEADDFFSFDENLFALVRLEEFRKQATVGVPFFL